MARRDKAGLRLITRHGNDFTSRFPIIVAAVTALPARSFLIGGEAIVTNGDGLAVFDLIRHKRHGKASWCAGLISALCLMSTTRVMTKSFSSRPASSAARASCRSDLARCMVRALAALDQDQESEGSGGEARSRRRLGPLIQEVSVDPLSSSSTELTIGR
jgi:hypothetical protein